MELVFSVNIDNINRLQDHINLENQIAFDISLSDLIIEDIMSPIFKTMPYINNKTFKPIKYLDKPWFHTRCKELYQLYTAYLHVFNLGNISSTIQTLARILTFRG